ncbi:BTAD domain-containing putative transcriptional regulator [Novosphingobium sp. BL-8A]|uniref:tetratricopeptide repeat protein n=1 Tax=Novosphingobium sp. BL-8A TaxID=3127639 RepID=UPI0037577FED
MPVPVENGIGGAQPVCVSLLGAFAMRRDGSSLPLPGRKARGILAYLALAPDRSATREGLACLLWTDRGTLQARGSLRHALKELRAVPGFADALAMTRDCVRLDDMCVSTDIDRISAAARAQDLDALAALLAHSHGDLLEDFRDISPGFDEWLVAERSRRREQVLGEVLDALRIAGLADMKNTRDILRSLDRLEPANEAAARLGMRLDSEIGDASSLHRRYRELCSRLESEFGARPTARTRELFHSLAGDLASGDADHVLAERRGFGTSGSLCVRDMVPLVLVSPLRTHGQDGEVRSFGEACADDIRTAVCQLRGLQVLSLDEADIGSVVGQADNALAIYSLSGSMRRIGAEYQANLQLANAASHVVVWAQTIRLAELEIAAIDALVEKASGAVVPAIDRDLERQLRLPGADLAEQGARYTRARLLIRQAGDLASVREAVDLLEGIVAADPGHIAARLALIRMYNTDFWQQVCGHDVQAFRDASEKHLQVAVGLQPGHCEVRLRQAWCELRKGDVAQAERDFQAALATLPHDPDVVNMCAFGLCHLGLYEAAEDLMQRAFRLNPFPPSDYHADYAVMASLRGLPEEAEGHFAVSGEVGMQYAAVRMANATGLDQGFGRMEGTAKRFRSSFVQAWQASVPPELDDVMQWVDYTLPLYPLEKRDFVKTGLRQMLAPRW